MKKIIIILITFLTVPVLSNGLLTDFAHPSVKIDGSRVSTSWNGSLLASITQTSTETPRGFYLGQNYPNPFNPQTNIYFSIPKDQEIKITVSNILGKEVAVIINGQVSAGTYRADFDGSGLSSGVYMYKLETAEFTSIKKMTLVK